MPVYMSNIGSSSSGRFAGSRALYRQLWLAPQYCPPHCRSSPPVIHSMPLNFVGYLPRDDDAMR